MSGSAGGIALVGGLPVVGGRARPRQAGHDRGRSGPRNAPLGRDRHRSGRPAGALRRLSDNPNRRPRRAAAGRGRARRAHVPRLPPARRPRVATARPRGHQGGPDAMIAIGEKAPEFTLPATTGEDVAFPNGGASVVVFTCNHCPYALAWHDRLLAVASEYADRGVQTVLINPNDAERYPRDSFDAMRERVEREGPWPAPYVHDESQEVARAYDAKTTPDV